MANRPPVSPAVQAIVDVLVGIIDGHAQPAGKAAAQGAELAGMFDERPVKEVPHYAAMLKGVELRPLKGAVYSGNNERVAALDNDNAKKPVKGSEGPVV